MEEMKNDYLQLFMDRDIALKFVEGRAISEGKQFHVEVRDYHSFPITTSNPMCDSNYAHHDFEGPHAQYEHQDYSMIQVVEGSSDMGSKCRALASHQEEPHERFEHEENYD